MTPQRASRELERVCRLTPVIPVLTVEKVSHAVPLAKALLHGGLPVLEVTLRTSVALDVIREMAQIDGVIVGAGTIINRIDAMDASEAGAQFGVSPGAIDSVLTACEEAHLPLLAGAATASESMQLLERGYTVQKFFPAEASGGIPMLKAISKPFPKVNFCPTGGISLEKAKQYLKLSNTLCVAGSWLTPRKFLEKADWKGINTLALQASTLTRKES